MLGDFNIDLLKFNSCSSICNFLDELSLSYFTPQIFLPSRIIGSTKTLIDIIFCNILQSSERNISANLTLTYSKDWPTIMQIDKGNPNLSFHNYIEEIEKMISNHAPLKNEISNFKANLGSPLVYKSL